MSEFLRWWFVLMLMGAVALPLCLAMFRPLADRGYALSKPFGLLILGFIFWFLNTFHILPNSRLGIVMAMVLIGAVSAAFVYRERDGLRDWLAANWRYVLAVEVAFFVVFAVAVWLRAMVGQINFTEQPMDLMFLNATTRAENFPPKDPWLSGHTVAYYYFGYLIVGMVGTVAGVPTAIGYNIGFAMIAALSAVAAFGLVYNLVRVREDAANSPAGNASTGAGRNRSETAPASPTFNWRPSVFGAAGALLLVVAGNFVWVLMFASSYGIGGRGFYRWIDVDALSADEARATWYPSEFFGFFNASRIYTLNDEGFRAITEFPMFSFILGDMHPHVMALPFVALVASVALALYRSKEPLDIVFWLQRPLLLLGVAILLGGLAFLNTWDIATMAFLVVAAAFLSNYGRVRGLTLDLFLQTATFAIPLLLLAIVLYVPFFASFSSQADGIGAVVTRPGITQAGTRPVHAFLYWSPLLIVVLPFVLVRLMAMRARITLVAAAVSAAVPALIVIAWAMFFAYQDNQNDPKLAGAWGFGRQIADRGTGWLTALAIAVVLAGVLLTLWLELTADDDRDERHGPIVTLLLVATAALLVMGTEFFYVGDLFNSRMNTVFKLYYQAWLLMAVAAGFALYYLSASWRPRVGRERAVRFVWGGAAALALVGAMLYPLGATYNRTRPYDVSGGLIEVRGELNGTNFRSKDELEGIARLNEIAQGQDFVIAEGIGNDYDAAVARVSASTGLPTVLGWRGHEDQWRGSDKPRAGRVEDIDKLYTTTSTDEMRQIIEKYGISYIVVGEFEAKYGAAGLAKFEALPLLFQSSGGLVRIYIAQ